MRDKRRLIFFVMVAASWTPPAAAENRLTPAITGTVADAETGAPLAGAFLHLGATDGPSALSDEHGRFRIAVRGPDFYELTVVADAYVAKTVGVPVTDADVAVDVDVELQATAKPGEVIVIHGKAPRVGEPTTYDLTVDDIRAIPGAGNDALKSLQTLPGVGRVPFGLGGLILRGVSPRNSAVFIDGIEVPILYHFGALASFYPSAMLENLELVAGGFSAQYGRALGGVVTMDSRPGRTDSWRGATEVSLLDASARAEGPGPRGGSLIIGMRRSYLEAFLPFFADEQGIDTTLAPSYLDGQLRYDVQRSATERLSFRVFGSSDQVALTLEADDGFGDGGLFDYRTRFVRAGLRWQKQSGPTSYDVSSWLGIDEYGLKTDYQNLERSGMPLGLRVSASHTLPHGYAAIGLDARSDSYDLRSFTDNERADLVFRSLGGYLDSAVWTELMHTWAQGRVSIKPGLRGEYYGLPGEWVLDPRLALSQRPQSWLTFRQTVGTYHQPPLLADYLWGNEDLRSSRSVQCAIGADANLPRGISFSFTGYYANLYDLPVDDPNAQDSTLATVNPYVGGAMSSSREFLGKQFGAFSVLENSGQGRSFGAEFLLRQVGPRWFGWIAYTHSRSVRRERMWDWVPYVLDQPHVLSALASTKIGPWRLGGRLRYSTGTPITPVLGAEYVNEGMYDPILMLPPFSERLPAAFQVDLRVDRVWRRNWGTASLFVDVQNVTNHTNVEGIMYNEDYSRAENTLGLPLFPSFGLELKQARPPLHRGP